MEGTKKNRNYMITSWIEPNFKDDSITYYIYQKEKCPTTGKEHYQCYVELNKPVSITQLKKIIADNTAHVDPRRGSQQEAVEYCSKSDTRIEEPVTEGILKKQGKRNDLELAVELIQNETDIVDIILEKPSLLRYINHLEKFKCMYDAKYKKRNEEPIVEVIVGEPGSGKTKSVIDKEPDIYIVPEASSAQFFDGYSDQEAVLFDDFKGNIRFNFMLQLLDRYNIRVNTKGGTTMWIPKRIYITSNYLPTQWYPNNGELENKALNRRIKNLVQK